MKPTKIEWTDMVWDIMTGCKHGCPYCYTKRFMKDRTPKYFPNRLTEPERIRKPKKVFVVNKGDMWGDWVPAWQIIVILSEIKECSWHTFQLLTKNPARMLEFELPKNTWAGASVTNQEDCHRIEIIRATERPRFRYISFEPILDFIDPDLAGIDWVVIGAETEKSADIPKDKELSQKFAGPLIEKVLSLKIPLFLKSNLMWDKKIQEFPE